MKKVAVIIGRFNPPTIGHYKIFDVVKKFIRDHEDLELSPIPVVIVINGKKTRNDKDRNPLTPHERISFMEASGKADGMKFMISTDAMAGLKLARSRGFEPIAVAVGSDRSDAYLGMLDKYFNEPDGTPIDHYAIEVDRGEDDSPETIDHILDYMDDSIPVSMVSGTLARQAVRKNELKKFSIIVGLENKPELAKVMFNKIKKVQE